ILRSALAANLIPSRCLGQTKMIFAQIKMRQLGEKEARDGQFPKRVAELRSVILASTEYALGAQVSGRTQGCRGCTPQLAVPLQPSPARSFPGVPQVGSNMEGYPLQRETGPPKGGRPRRLGGDHDLGRTFPGKDAFPADSLPSRFVRKVFLVQK